MHATMETAVDDELTRRNPRRIDGAGQQDSDEREVIPLPAIFDIAARIPARWRAPALLATFAQMRFGELAGLTRDRLDLDNCEIRIRKSLVQPDKGGLIFEDPKSRGQARAVVPRRARARTPQPPRPLRRTRPARPRLRRPQGRQAPPEQLQQDLVQSRGFRWCARCPLPRPAAHRRHARRDRGRGH